MNVYDLMNMSYDFKGERTKFEYGCIPAGGLGLEGVDPTSRSYVCFMKISSGHRISEDGGILNKGGAGGGTGAKEGSGPSANKGSKGGVW